MALNNVSLGWCRSKLAIFHQLRPHFWSTRFARRPRVSPEMNELDRVLFKNIRVCYATTTDKKVTARQRRSRKLDFLDLQQIHISIWAHSSDLVQPSNGLQNFVNIVLCEFIRMTNETPRLKYLNARVSYNFPM